MLSVLDRMDRAEIVPVVAFEPAESLTVPLVSVNVRPAETFVGDAATAVLLARSVSKTCPSVFSLTTNHTLPSALLGSVMVAERGKDEPAATVPVKTKLPTSVGLSPWASVAM